MADKKDGAQPVVGLEMSQFENSLLVLRAGTLWQEATTAAFLDAMSDGTLPQEAFNRWLVQDHHFADALTSFQAIAAAKTPRQFRKPLIAGLGALDAEMDWFEAQASARGLKLNAPVHEVCRHYCDFLIQAAYREPYSVLLAVLFGVEASYLAAWSGLPAKGPYAEFIDRWSNPRFAEYVESLRVLAEGNLHESSQRYFDSALAHERDFWRMTWGE
jgi:formylaminopyrimidine deformylase / aminopyrimidine aminohydrolase